MSTTLKTATSLRRGSINLLELQELMRQEARQQQQPADQPLPGSPAGSPATPPEAPGAAHGCPPSGSSAASELCGGGSPPASPTPCGSDARLSLLSLLSTCSRQSQEEEGPGGPAAQGPRLAHAASLPAGHAAGAGPARLASLGSGGAGGKGQLAHTSSLPQPMPLPAGALHKGKRSASGASLASMARGSALALALPPAEPLLPLEPRLSAQLARLAGKAVRLLEQLQRPAPAQLRAADSEAPLMPSTALRFAKGLLFSFQKKAGLGVGWRWGQGFVIAQLPGGTWSAPSFLACRHLSLGLTCGFQHTKRAIAIATQEALDAFMGEHADGGWDVHFSSQDPLHVEPSAWVVAAGPPPAGPAALHPDRHRSTAYLVAQGAMFDVSRRCGLSFVDEGLNSALYGVRAAPADILAGRFQRPPEFEPLYADLAQAAGTASAVRSTQSKFHAFREKQQRQVASRGRGLERARSLASTLSLSSPAGGSPVALRRSMTAASGAGSVRSEDTGRFTALFPELLGGPQEEPQGQGEAEAGPRAGGFVALFPDVEDQVRAASGAGGGAPGQEPEGQLLAPEGEAAQPAHAAGSPAQCGASF